jgi:proteasome accessory factor B
MASEKNERLVNLVIALLAAKKYLTKAQIFKAVAGYDGSVEASDRMFERDKEELRALGIQIDMKSIDPLFDDEIGYRILPDRYKFDLGPLTSEEVSILALATETWKESALGDIASTTARRLNSLGLNADFSDLPLAPTIANVPSSLGELLEAIEQRKIIEIEYLNSEDAAEKKKLAPYGLYSQKQRWYLYALDTEKNDKRSYRLDRFVGIIKKSPKSFERDAFTLPTTYFPAVEVLLDVRRDYVNYLLSRAEIITEGDEWIRAKVVFNSEAEALTEILKNMPNIKVLEPVAIVSAVTKSLSELVALHGK